MNPLISMEGICDPHIHIYNGKAYLYATCDNLRPGVSQFEMTKWKIFSSEDLIHWTLENTEYPENFHCGPITMCWAVDAAEKNGRYYFYFSNRWHAVGVGVSDNPAGPFREALGHPLVSEDTPPVGVKKWDPCVFVDDDGSAYLIAGSAFGTDEYQMAKLNEDMISLAEPLRSVPYFGNPDREDKVTIHKENGRYYLSHSSFYAVSDNVYGPYVQRGNTLSNIDHGCFFTYHNQTYQATGGMDNPNQYFRASFLCYCHYRNNGDIVVDQVPMGYGVGQYDASWEKIEAEWFFDCAHARKQERSDGGFEMAVEEGGWLAFPNTCHLEENTAFDLYYETTGHTATLEIRENSPEGNLLGTMALESGGSFGSCRLCNSEGHKNLYLVLSRGSAAIDSFSLGSDHNRSSAEAARAVALGHGETVACSGAAADRALCLKAPGDGAAMLLDGGPGGLTNTFLRCGTKGAADLVIQSENGDAVTLNLPDTDGSIRSFPLVLPFDAGVNRITVTLGEGGCVFLDSLRTEQEKSIFRSYPAANGRIYPFGNGCWDGLAQPEWSREAYSGRMVSNLCQPGFRVAVHVDGGGMGGRFGLLIRYSLKGSETALCRVEVNGGLGGLVELKAGAASAATAVELRPGDNEITLVVLSASQPGLTVDAFSITP